MEIFRFELYIGISHLQDFFPVIICVFMIQIDSLARIVVNTDFFFIQWKWLFRAEIVFKQVLWNCHFILENMATIYTSVSQLPQKDIKLFMKMKKHSDGDRLGTID